MRAPERLSALRMPRRERLNCPALLALTSGVGGALAGSGALRGRYGGRGTGNVVWRIGKGSSRSRFDGAAMCGLSVKRAVRRRVKTQNATQIVSPRRTVLPSSYPTFPLVIVPTPDFLRLS